jgi:hypothetical protein
MSITLAVVEALGRHLSLSRVMQDFLEKGTSELSLGRVCSHLLRGFFQLGPGTELAVWRGQTLSK